LSKEIQKKVRPLTLKQTKWLKLYLESGNATLSAMECYNTKDYFTASQIGHDNLKKANIKATMDVYFDKYNLTPDRMAKELDRNLQERNWKSRDSAIDKVLKLKGAYPKESKESVNNNIFIAVNEDHERFK